MLLKLMNGNYVDTNSGMTLATQRMGEDGKAQVYFRTGPNGFVTTVQDGYKDREEAQAALDDLMAQEDYVELAQPAPDDEVESEPTDNYDDATVPQLRDELASPERDLPTTGTKGELIERLRENDRNRNNA